MFSEAASLAARARSSRSRSIGSRLNWSRNYAAKEMRFGEDARRSTLKGIEGLAGAVKFTMGPRERNVIIERSFGAPTGTGDGVTVAESIQSKPPCIYMNRLFPKSNSSFLLSRGIALQSEVLRLGEHMFLMDSGVGTPRILMQDETTGVPTNQATRFENKVGFIDLVAGESQINKHILERFFIDLVTGESLIKERAAARFNDLVGSTDVVAGEPLLLLPRRFRQNQARIELNQARIDLNKQTNTKVKGFLFGRVRGGYSVAIAGHLAFMPFRGRLGMPFRGRVEMPFWGRVGRKTSNVQFTIESINLNRNINRQ